MKFKLIAPFIVTVLLLSSFSNIDHVKVNDPDPEKDKVLISVLKYMLTRGHFVVKNMDDDFSEHVFNTFIEGLDPSKRYFTQKDIKDFSRYKYLIDDQLKDADLSFYKLVYSRFTEKVKSAKDYYGVLLAQPFNFKKMESIDIDYENIPFATNENELIDFWRK